MFSGFFRWFHQHVVPEVNSDVQAYFMPLLHDAGSLVGTVALDAVTTTVSAFNATGQFNPSTLIQAAVDDLKSKATVQLLPEAEHALVGMVTAAVANLHATSAGATVGTDIATVVQSAAPDEKSEQKAAEPIGPLSKLTAGS